MPRRRLGVHESDVEDVCQEVFVVVDRRKGDFEGRSSAKTWVYGIALRTASDYRKRPSHRRETLTSEPPEERSTDDPHEALEARQARQQGHPDSHAHQADRQLVEPIGGGEPGPVRNGAARLHAGDLLEGWRSILRSPALRALAIQREIEERFNIGLDAQARGDWKGAVAEFLWERLVAGRGAADDGGDPGVAEFETVVAGDGQWSGGEAKLV